MSEPQSDAEDRLKGDETAIDDDAPRLGEHDRHAGSHPRLDLSEAPIRPFGVAHDHSRLEELVHRGASGAADRLSDADMAGLVGSRIYHDIINPLGAIGNGVELLGLSGQAEAPVLDLLTQSVEAATAKLRFLRLAFGSASQTQELAAIEVAALLAAMSRSGRLKVDWRLDDLAPAPLVRLMLLAILCLDMALPLGGKVVVQRHRDGWRLRAEAARLRDLPELWRVFEGRGSARIDAATLQFPMAARRASEMGIFLSTNRTETTIEIEALPLSRHMA